MAEGHAEVLHPGGVGELEPGQGEVEAEGLGVRRGRAEQRQQLVRDRLIYLSNTRRTTHLPLYTRLPTTFSTGQPTHFHKQAPIP